MRLRSLARRVLGLGVPLALTVVAATAYAASAEPDYEMPFPCVQSWTGTTRSTHSPSPKAIDFNRTDDIYDLVTVSAPGVVSKVVNLGSQSYGLYVVVDHGNGRSSVYAHLYSAWVVPGQVVDQGTVLGQVGSSGGSTGPHLHFEERVDGTDVTARFHGTTFVMGSTLASANCPDVPVAGDWDGDGVASVGVFRRAPAASFQRSGSTALSFGKISDDPVVGDWDGDGTTDPGVRRGLSGNFLLRGPTGTVQKVLYGRLGDRPLAGDWDGNSTDEVGVFRPANGTFYLRASDGTTTSVRLGAAGTYPVTGDWNGDGRTDLAVFSPTTAAWTLRYAGVDGTVWTAALTFGHPGDLPVTGDWDGDGRTDLGAWSPATATYSLRTGVAPTARITTTRFGNWR